MMPALVSALATPLEQWPPARPLVAELDRSEPYPVAALGPVLAPMAQRIHAVVRAPAALCAQAVLGAASFVAQPHADIVIDGRRHPISLYLATVGDSGERKSAVDTCAMTPIDDFEREIAARRAAELATYEAQHLAWETERSDICRTGRGAAKRSRGGREAELEELGPAPMPPVPPVTRPTDPTTAGLVRLYMLGVPSAALITDEAGSLLGGYSLQETTKLATYSTYSRFWDGSPIDRVRANDGAIILHGRRLTLHLAGQPIAIGELLADPVAASQGVLGRFLITWPESTIGTRAYSGQDLWAADAAVAYRAAVLTALRAAPRLRLDADGQEIRGELDPRALEIVGDARRLWIEFYDHIENNLADGRPYAGIRSLAAKAPEHAARLAGVMALLENINADRLPVDAMERGTRLAEFYLHERVRLSGGSAVRAGLRRAEALLAWVHEKALRELTIRDVCRGGPKHLRSAAIARAAVATLADHGWLLPCPDATRASWCVRPNSEVRP